MEVYFFTPNFLQSLMDGCKIPCKRQVFIPKCGMDQSVTWKFCITAKVLKNHWSKSHWKWLIVILPWEERLTHFYRLGTYGSHCRASETKELIVYTRQSSSGN